MSDEQTQDQEVVLYVQTNSLADQAPYELLKMLYKGAYDNTLGIMEAYNEETGGLEYLLVGLGPDEETRLVNAYPLAKIFSGPEDFAHYSAPDGKGGYDRVELVPATNESYN
jgi:hypothetical protein